METEAQKYLRYKLTRISFPMNCFECENEFIKKKSTQSFCSTDCKRKHFAKKYKKPDKKSILSSIKTLERIKSL